MVAFGMLEGSVKMGRLLGAYRRPDVLLGIGIVVAVVTPLVAVGHWTAALASNYLALHMLIEICVVVISFGIATVGFATFDKTRDLHILALSWASIGIGFCDLGHALTFGGMPTFFGTASVDKTLSFWLIGRGLGALTYLYVAASAPKLARSNLKIWKLVALSSSLSIVVACYLMILFHPEDLPVFFIVGSGITRLKIALEWVFLILSAGASLLLFRKAESESNLDLRWAGSACGLYSLCGYFFTIYSDMDDVYVFVGHCLKLLSYLALYRAVFSECVSRPYARAEQLAGEAAAASLAKSRFLANMSHEFRTPLGIIAGFSELILKSDKLDSSLKSSLTIVFRNSKRLSFLINDLLDLAKAEQEKIEIVFSRFNLRQLVREICEDFGVHASSKSVALKISGEFSPDHLIVNDENRVRQIIVNLVSNALKFTGSGSIEISATAANEQTIIAVKDSGIGMSASEIEILFTPFAQFGDPSKRTLGGTGLGLALSKNLARMLEGDLILHRSAREIGSEFRLIIKHHDLSLLPQSHATHLTNDASPAPQTPDFSKFRILVADDSLDNQALIGEYLGPTAANLNFAENGRQAVDLVVDGNFDLILMDIQMPEMDGFEATHELRRRNVVIPIVAITAHALAPERERALSSGFNQYLVKPIQIKDLWCAISHNLAIAPRKLHSDGGATADSVSRR